MKIGTLNCFDAQNFGSALIAYSLKKEIESHGHACFCIDYKSSLRENLYPNISAKFVDWRKQFLYPLGSPNDKYDAIIYGSDAIWKAYQGNIDSTYWGSNKLLAEKKFTYGVSFVKADWEHMCEEFETGLSNFDAIAVREKELKERIGAFCNKRIVHVCDPTFFLNVEQWSEISSPRIIEGKYGIFYNQQIRLDSALQICRRLRESTLMPFYIFSSNDCLLRDCDGKTIKKDLIPSDFLSLYKYSAFVCACSYHGTVFSLIFKKPFIVIHPYNNERTVDLLKLLDISKLKINHSNDLDIRTTEIDYTLISKKLSKHIVQSKAYLQMALSNKIIITPFNFQAALVYESISNKSDVISFMDKNPHYERTAVYYRDISVMGRMFVPGDVVVVNCANDNVTRMQITKELLEEGFTDKQILEYTKQDEIISKDAIKEFNHVCVASNSQYEIIKNYQRDIAKKIALNKEETPLILGALNCVFTTRCSLKCKNCCGMIQYFRQGEQSDLPYQGILNAAKRVSDIADFVDHISLNGGEMFLYKDIKPLLKSVAKMQFNCGRIMMFTNATIIPDAEVLTLIREANILLQINNYNISKNNTFNFVKKCLEYGVDYVVHPSTKKWYNGPHIINKLEAEDAIKHSKSCYLRENNIKLTEDRFYMCSFLQTAYRLEAIEDDNRNYLKIWDSGFTKQKIIEYLKTTPPGCAYCSGWTAESIVVPAGEQITSPISYRKNYEKNYL